MRSVLRPLDPLAVCPKSASGTVSCHYIAADVRPDEPREHLSKRCSICGFLWREEPATPEQIAEAASKRIEHELTRANNRRKALPRPVRRWLRILSTVPKGAPTVHSVHGDEQR